MGRFKFGGLVSGGTGRFVSDLGGMVLLKNGVFRNYVTPANPQTGHQGESRAAFAVLTEAWKGLSQTDQNAWIAAWQSGDWLRQDPLTGTSRSYGSAKSLFISLNFNYLIASSQVAAPYVEFTTPPVKATLSPIGITSVAIDASAGTVAVSYTGTLLSESLVFNMTAPVSAGNNRLTSVKSRLKQITASQSATPLALGTDYVARVGSISGATGLKVGYTVEIISETNGQRGFVASGFVTIVA